MPKKKDPGNLPSMYFNCTAELRQAATLTARRTGQGLSTFIQQALEVHVAACSQRLDAFSRKFLEILPRSAEEAAQLLCTQMVEDNLRSAFWLADEGPFAQERAWKLLSIHYAPCALALDKGVRGTRTQAFLDLVRKHLGRVPSKKGTVIRKRSGYKKLTRRQ